MQLMAFQKLSLFFLFSHIKIYFCSIIQNFCIYLIKYERLVDRFFRESVNVFEPERSRMLRIECLDDSNYYLNLLDLTIEYYQMYD